MPIKPENKHRYPDNWKANARRTRRARKAAGELALEVAG